MQDRPVNQRTRIRILQLNALLFGAAILTMNPAFSGDGSDLIEEVGVAMVLACIVGRMWCILYIGSRKNRELVIAGPYSVTRNPLYVFSVMGAVGIGFFVGSLLLAAFLGLAVSLVLVMTARNEAVYLESLFGEQYRRYASETPLFLPNPRLYRDSEEVPFSPAALRRTFLDGLLFIAAFPAIEMMEYLKDVGYLPMLFRFP